jgi:hypothetical protein
MFGLGGMFVPVVLGRAYKVDGLPAGRARSDRILRGHE